MQYRPLLLLLAPLLAGLARPMPYREELLTDLLCSECSVCGEDEQVAVAATVLERSRRRGRSVEAVLLRPGQYSTTAPWCSYESRRRYLPAAQAALKGHDPTGGATLFHARWACSVRPYLCHHDEDVVCLDAVWPTAEEVQVPDDWRHRFYREP